MRGLVSSRYCFFVVLAAMGIPLPATPGQAPGSLPAGEIIDDVVCVSDSTETYSLYLPSAYDPTKQWPIIYAFDPLARGKTPVKLYREAAERYGYIVAGSNTSQNFGANITKSVNAIWRDTHARLALDPRRIYMTGFSGGARVAGDIALRCQECKVAGVIAHGAGYANETQLSRTDSLLYFLAVGNQDFNWPEIMRVRRHREDKGLSYRVEVFAGTHQWAPPAVIEEAVEWIRLKAMQAGAQPPEAAFVKRLFEETERQASDAEKRGDAIAELSAYRSLVTDFKGLEDVSVYEMKLATLQKSGALKEALKKEDASISRQQQAYEQAVSRFDALGETAGEEQINLRVVFLQRVRELKAEADHAGDEETRLIYLRALNAIWAHGIETGQAQLEKRHFEKAEYSFKLMSETRPDEPWPVLLLAETKASSGDEKQALKYIKEAIKRGLKNPDSLEKNRNLQNLRGQPEFQQIVDSLKAEPPGR